MKRKAFGNLHGRWQELSDRLRDANLHLDDVVSVVVAKMAAGGVPASYRFDAMRLTRQRINEGRVRLDAFLDLLVPRAPTGDR